MNLFRVPVPADENSGLAEDSWVMVDRITAVPRSALGRRIGRLSDRQLVGVDRSLVVFLGLG
jgi:mRNA interferase MazF